MRVSFLIRWPALVRTPTWLRGACLGPSLPEPISLMEANDVTRQSNASSAATYVGTRLADHCSGVHHVSGRARRSYCASAAAQRVHFVVGVRIRWLRGEHGAMGVIPVSPGADFNLKLVSCSWPQRM